MNSERRFFLAIRHNPTGGFLPSLSSYGFTREEPSTVLPPRLFTKPAAAANALNAWLQGEWFEAADKDEFGGETQIRIRPNAARRREDMEIVEIELIVRTLTQAKLRLL